MGEAKLEMKQKVFMVILLHHNIINCSFPIFSKYILWDEVDSGIVRNSFILFIIKVSCKDLILGDLFPTKSHEMPHTYLRYFCFLCLWMEVFFLPFFKEMLIPRYSTVFNADITQ